ncbi:MAG TPA: hypothetical protein VN756_12750 [Solirubrobacterales bacterium]|nr:hypothetical protein [Solirubrobacterales bacterium]
MRKRLLAIGALLAACAALTGGAVGAGAATVRVGTLVLKADGGFQPQVLPKRTFAPIRFQGHGDIETTDGSVPPALQHVKLEFDRDGRVTTAGLSVCPPASIEAASPQQARQLCADAIVGTGHLGAAVPLPGLGRIALRSPLTLFNGPARNGNPTVVVHAQAPFPILETYVVVIEIERRQGTFGYRASFDIPPIAGGLGALTHLDAKVGRRYRAGGVERSYVSARCSDFILQTQGYFSFADGTVVYGSVFKVCRTSD